MKSLITVAKLLVSLLLLWFLARTSKLDFSLLPHLLYSPGWLLITLSLYGVIVALSAWRWHQLNKVQHIPLSYSRTVLPTYLGIAFNNLLPGGVGGDFFRFYFLNKRAAAKKSVVMLSVLVDRITGLTGIFIAVCLTAAFHLSAYTQQAVTMDFTWVCLAICVVIVALYFASSLLPSTVGLSLWLTRRFAGKTWLPSVLSLLEAIRIYRNAKMVIANCLATSVLIQGLIAVTCLLIAKMMHFPAISFIDYIMAIAVTQIVNLIPIAPGGFGVGEIAFANILTLLNPGVSATYATIFLAYRIIGILVYLPGVGVFIFDRHLLKKQDILTEELA